MFNIYATDYAPVDPITPPCDITPIFIGYKGENKARCLIFDLTECVETFGDGGFVISFIRQGDDLPYLVTDTDRLDNNAIWIITDTDTAVDGYGMVQLQYIVDDVVCKSALYRTVTFDSNSITGDVPDPYEDLLAQIAAYAAQAEGAATTATAAAATATTAVEEGVKTERSQRIAADEGLNTRINELMGLAGAPSMANSAAAMTDSSKVYVYTGSEAGYLTGHWYYYNGTEWADGGVYQATAVDTDKTLTVENMAADAAVVGDKIDECMAAFVVNSASGDIASFADGADGVPLRDLVVNIQPKQAGTGDPSPSNVRAISGWTEANIYRYGGNVLDLSVLTTSAYEQGITFTVNADGSVTANGTTTAQSQFTWAIPLATAKIFTGLVLAGCPSGCQLRLEKASYPYTAYAIDTGNGATISEPAGACNLIVRIPSGMTMTNRIIAPQISGFTDGVNRPYNADSTVYNISFGTAGTVYGGTLDVTSGMLTVTHKAIDLGNVDVFYSEADSGRFRIADSVTSDMMASPNRTLTILCSCYKPNIGGGAFADLTIYNSASKIIYIVDASYANNLDGFKASLTGQTAVYPLQNPISVQLDPVSVASLLGNNNIWSDTGSVASCEYRADTKLYIEHLTDPDDDMVANANITSGSYFMVGNSLYLATANIANGGAITPGTNCTATNLAAALNAINS